MVKLDWLADVHRDAGLNVIEYEGWKTRTMIDFDFYTPVGLLNHHTTAPVPYPSDRLLSKCNLTIRPDGTVIILNAGWAFDSGFGDRKVLDRVRADGPIGKPTDTYLSLSPQVVPGGTNPGVVGNAWFIDNEVQHLGDGSPIPTAQREALIASNVAICKFMGWNPMTRLLGHREWTIRKIDPRWDGFVNPMPQIRLDTVEGGEDMSKQDALDALQEFFGNSRSANDPQGMLNPDGSPRQRRYVDAIVDSVWHATHGRLGDKNPAKTLDWLTRPLAEVPTVTLDAIAKAVSDEIARRVAS